MTTKRTRTGRRVARHRRTTTHRWATRMRRWIAGLTTSHKLALVGATLLGLVVLATVAVALAGNQHTTMPAATMPRTAQALLMSTDMQLRFDTLSTAHTDTCTNLGNKAALYTAMAQMRGDSSLQGSCCSAMDFQHYRQQIAALKPYADIAAIPADPYNVPATLANRLLLDDETISLTAAQQAIYNQASGMTQDHGWCCCQCWAWYAHSGLAKYLITAKGFTAAQVVTVINLEDCCGGS